MRSIYELIVVITRRIRKYKYILYIYICIYIYIYIHIYVHVVLHAHAQFLVDIRQLSMEFFVGPDDID
jgi:hypothetical protein